MRGSERGVEDLVSIIMPSYNTAAFIADSIRSVLAQSYQSWELLILDDCSTDGTEEIVAPFLNKTKADEWALADRLGILDVIRNQTVTCYNGIPGDGCGKCPACKLRNRGYREFLRAKAAKNGRTVGI